MRLEARELSRGGAHVPATAARHPQNQGTTGRDDGESHIERVGQLSAPRKAREVEDHEQLWQRETTAAMWRQTRTPRVQCARTAFTSKRRSVETCINRRVCARGVET